MEALDGGLWWALGGGLVGPRRTSKASAMAQSMTQEQPASIVVTTYFGEICGQALIGVSKGFGLRCSLGKTSMGVAIALNKDGPVKAAGRDFAKTTQQFRIKSR